MSFWRGVSYAMQEWWPASHPSGIFARNQDNYPMDTFYKKLTMQQLFITLMHSGVLLDKIWVVNMGTSD